jgi:fumarylacetoacetase
MNAPTPQLDETHDPNRRSWVESAGDPATDFPLQNLPLGVGRTPGGQVTVLTAIGDEVLDLQRVAAAGLLPDVDPGLLRGTEGLNPLLSRPPEELTAMRRALADLLERGAGAEHTIRASEGMLRPAGAVAMLTPTRIGSFTDFFAGIYHAQAASKALRRSGDLGPNYRWVPIAYQSRGSTVRPSGVAVRRPTGQLPRPDANPEYRPCEMLDFELELGVFVGNGTTAGEPVPIAKAAGHIAGFCLLNDWSARDIQRWEMAPLGPFLSKNFATTISPWLVTADALRPFRIPAMARADGDPPPLPYLHDPGDQARGGVAIELSVWLRTADMQARGDEPALVTRTDARHLYWTPAQMLAHHTSGGCDLQTGDLLGTGTISGPAPDQLASLLELTDDGRAPISLDGGTTRGYLEDGDEVTFTGRCARDGYVSIGFGTCAGTITPAAGI